ncbi:MAG: DUF2330 domain-containing protein [Leptospiraceae bacterium]|nr:DUF2330 domain-containing protein [Leptospiraceae bacterium]MCP5501235.1 DUF2330 domain-containing protein [Leptospiraceae bacterium]
MKAFTFFVLFIILGLSIQDSIYSMCTMFIRPIQIPKVTYLAPGLSKGDKGLYNEVTRVVLARDGKRSVMGISSDYRGNFKEFSMLVPVPSLIKKNQIHVGENQFFDRLHGFTSPLFEVKQDLSPCLRMQPSLRKANGHAESVAPFGADLKPIKNNYSVKVEASYSIGEYDIQILSSQDSKALVSWLKHNGYYVPKLMENTLEPYIKQNMKFFVAKVNLQNQLSSGLNYLRPLLFAYESEKFILPIRPGMVNAKGEQELYAYILNPTGRVETSNYRNVEIPTGKDLPEHIASELDTFYREMFLHLVKKEDKKVVFTEFAGKANVCSRTFCPQLPLKKEELLNLGAFWLSDVPDFGIQPEVYVTRLHIRYNSQTFPEDISFIETNDKKEFSIRYKIRKAWKGSENSCSVAGAYFKNLKIHQEKSLKNLIILTGRNENEERKKMGLNYRSNKTDWWKTIWN